MPPVAKCPACGFPHPGLRCPEAQAARRAAERLRAAAVVAPDQVRSAEFEVVEPALVLAGSANDPGPVKRGRAVASESPKRRGRPKADAGLVVLTAKVPPALVEALDRHAAALGLSRSAAVREWLESLP